MKIITWLIRYLHSEIPFVVVGAILGVVSVLIFRA